MCAEDRFKFWESGECPNKHNHVSAFPAFDRIKCPYCNKVYIQATDYIEQTKD